MLNLNWLKPLQTNASDSANLDYQAHKGIITMLQFSITLLIFIISRPYFTIQANLDLRNSSLIKLYLIEERFIKKTGGQKKKSYVGELES